MNSNTTSLEEFAKQIAGNWPAWSCRSLPDGGSTWLYSHGVCSGNGRLDWHHADDTSQQSILNLADYREPIPACLPGFLVLLGLSA